MDAPSRSPPQAAVTPRTPHRAPRSQLSRVQRVSRTQDTAGTRRTRFDVVEHARKESQKAEELWSGLDNVFPEDAAELILMMWLGDVNADVLHALIHIRMRKPGRDRDR